MSIVDKIKSSVEKNFPSIVEAIQGLVRIPNLSPNFDLNIEKNGYQNKAAAYIKNWVMTQNIKDLTCEILKDEGHTPFIFIEVPGTDQLYNNTVLLYGHLDKQPWGDYWSKSKPTEAKISDDGKLLYGRGAADDGYAIFAIISALKALQENNIAHPRIVVTIEGAEESNTVDLFYYINILKDYIGTPKLIVCLDSGVEDYKRLWVTSSLRGVLNIDMKVSVVTKGVHSGVMGGLVPDSFMILRKLLDRIQDSSTGKILIPYLNVEVPDNRLKEIKVLAEDILGPNDYTKYIPFVDGVKNLGKTTIEMIINNTWSPTLTVVGAEGFPEIDKAGNVIRPYSEVRLSFRLPPLVDGDKAVKEISNVLLKDVPFNGKVELFSEDTGTGWNAKPLSDKLRTTLSEASKAFFGGNDLAYLGEGGSVPFVNAFEDMYPAADIAVMGVTGTDSNIHGPDENLNLDYCKTLIMSVSYILNKYS